jgi:hypothetical protein
MPLGFRNIIALWLVTVTQLAGAAPSSVPVVLQSLNNPAGLRALESFAGPDRRGKNGIMARVGFDLALLFHEHRDFVARRQATGKKDIFKFSRGVTRIKDELVVVDTVAAGDVMELMAQLQAHGMQQPAVYGRMVSGLLPISSLEKVAQLSSLKLARPAVARSMAGAVTSQGDAAMLADDARTAFSINGAGVTIGTLSDSYDCQGGAAGDFASGDLPAGIQVLEDEAGCGSGSDEGRAMMQIIHDVAPGASQAFHSAFNGTAAFASGIVDLATVAGADIINDDVIYFAEPMFQDGIIAQAVDSVKAMGVAYFSAAGNQADESYEDNFRNSGVSGSFAGNVRHDFDAGAGVDTLMEVSISANSRIFFVLQWDDPFFSVSGAPGADTDMDIVLYSDTGQVLASAVDNNLGGDAVEIFSYLTTGGQTNNYQIAIEHYAGPLPGKIKLVYFGNMTIKEFATRSGTSYGHAIAAGGQAVGAVRYDRTPEYGVSPPRLESFSSHGGTPILFDTAGNPVMELRQKPDFVAPDGGDNTFFGSDYEGNGSPNFFGTSAAAPHAAGIAALLREHDSSLDVDELYAVLQSTAIDMDVAGFDYKSGHGLVQATLALAALLPPDGDLDGVPDGEDNCPLVANMDQLDYDADGQGDACDADDDNDGLDDVDETAAGTNPLNPDSDNDTLNDGEEVNTYLTSPLLADSDGDGFGDAVEIAAGSDPNSGSSIPASTNGDINNDGILNAADVLLASRFVIGSLTPDSAQFLRGDVAPIVNNVSVPDGLFNVGDLLIIQRWMLISP